uniref:SSD domain-containing protein n=1 Tax=Plectus sambesii TaxID=2011161 RepID=A0A914X5J9_9BILA
MLTVVLERFFECYARFLGRNVKWFIIVPVSLVCLLSLGWCRFEMYDDPRRMFTPETSFWKRQEQSLWRFINADVDGMIYVMLLPKENGNVVERKVARDLVAVIDHLENNITLAVEGEHIHLGRLLNTDAPHADVNKLVTAFMKLTAHRTKSTRLITYPMADLFQQNFFVPLSFGDVRSSNGTLDYAGSLVLFYLLNYETQLDKERHWQFQEKLWQYSRRSELHKDVDVIVFTWKSLLLEMRKNTYQTLQFTPGAFLLMIVFSIVAMFDWKVSKSLHLHAMAGLISTLMSFMSSMGLMYGIGYEYNDLVSITSFLALAIGVDDTFIMLSAWKRHGHIGDPRERLVPMFVEAGSSIFFTSLTDVLAFGVGMTMDIPALRHFCLFTGVAIFFDFILQVSFYPAAMVVCDRLRPTVNRMMGLEKLSVMMRRRSVRAMEVTALKEREGESSSTVASICIKLINSRPLRVLFTLLTICTSVVALLGICWIRPDSNIAKLMTDDSPFKTHMSVFDKHFWSKGALFQFAVNAPKYTNESDMNRFESFVSKLESLPTAVGSTSTNLWLREFTFYMIDWSVEYTDANSAVLSYLNGQEITRKHMTFEPQFDATTNKTFLLPSRFLFTTAFWGGKTWAERADLLERIGKILVEFSDYEPAAYNDIVHLGDVLLYTRTALKQTLGTALFTTFFISLLFVPLDNPRSLCLIVLMATSFISINAAVIGYLSLWDVDVDIVSMVTILMSVGFSVDYTVHMAFTYARQSTDKYPSSADRIRNALREVATPIFLAATSTLTAVSLLAFVGSYMIRVFLKTIFLVVIFGMVQSLIVLPIFFMGIDKRGTSPTNVRRSQSVTSQVPLIRSSSAILRKLSTW